VQRHRLRKQLLWCEQLWLQLNFDASIIMTTSITVSAEGEREVIVVEVPQQAG
jgi:hypothetical protein